MGEGSPDKFGIFIYRKESVQVRGLSSNSIPKSCDAFLCISSFGKLMENEMLLFNEVSDTKCRASVRFVALMCFLL